MEIGQPVQELQGCRQKSKIRSMSVVSGANRSFNACAGISTVYPLQMCH